MLSFLKQQKDNYLTLNLKWGTNETIFWKNLGQSWKNMWQFLDMLMLKVGQSQNSSTLKTGQQTELRTSFAKKLLILSQDVIAMQLR